MCGARVVSVLEGGYGRVDRAARNGGAELRGWLDCAPLAECVLYHLFGLSGEMW
jgi:hypothetical protein